MKNLKALHDDKSIAISKKPDALVKERGTQEIVNKEPEALLNIAEQASQYARSLIEASLDPLVTISLQGKIMDVNEASAKVTGETRDKLIGTDFYDYFTEPEKAREGYKQVFDKGFVSDYPLTIRHKNGNLTDVLYNASVYKDDSGNVLGVFAAARDITAQKQASQYARSLIEASLDPLVTISPQGKIMDVNEASTKVTGETRDKLIGTDFSDYFTEPEKAREGYKQVFEKGFVSDYPLTIRHKNGSLTDVLYNASVYKDDRGNVLGVFAAARDITAQKQASQYARSLIEASLDPLVTISLQGKIMDVNEASTKVTGETKQKLIGTDFSDYFTEPEKAREGYKQVFEKGSVSDYPLTIRHKNGNLTDVLYNASVYKDDRGNVLGVFAAARDVTEQKAAEEKIRQSEELFKSIFDNSLAAIVVTNDKGIYLSANKAASELLGYSVNELLQMNVGDLKTTVKHGAIERFEKYKRKGEETGEFDFILKNGVQKFVKYQAIKIKTDFHLSIMMDITEQKQASQYARSLIEASLDPLVTISPDGIITDVNEASTIVTGEARDKLIGTDFSDYFTEPEKAREGYRQVFEKGFVSDYPLTIHHKNGNLTDVLYNASVYKDDRGIALGVFAAARDVTSQKRITEELKEAKVVADLATLNAEEAQVAAESALQSKQQFLANMSHEIRTPMNAILGFTKIILKTDLALKQKEYLNAIRTSSDGLLVLINDILDLAKVDAGKMIFEQIPFKMEFSISTVFQMFDLKIQEKNLELVIAYDNKIPEVLIGDTLRLQQILLNLLSNALKFTEKGKIILSVCLLHEDNEKATIGFTITDTGSGIPEDKLESIFENFQQATSSTSRMFGGTGLGLAICKQLVEKQGGTIAVKSTVNEGSAFSFALSFQKTKEGIEKVNGEIELDKEIKDIKILVVEDVKLNQLLMRVILDDFNFKYDIADNGKIAIEKLQTETYDIILMDLQMPEMNGFEATDYIRNTMNLKIPIIALTADVTTVDVEKCRAFGMNDYVSKPLDERVLHAKIIELLAQ